MNAAPFVVIMTAATVALVAAAQAPGKNKIVNVEIVVGTYAAHDKLCKDPKSKVHPTTVFVSTVPKGKDVQVHHCVKGTLLDHKSHKTNPDAFETTIPDLSTGDQIRWFTSDKKTTFTVQVAPHDPVHSLAPKNPFEEPLPKNPLIDVLSRPVVDVKGAVVKQQYKATFQIVGVGKADPDFNCSM